MPGPPPLVAYADGAGAPVTSPDAVAGAGAHAVLGWSPEPRPWHATVTGVALMAGYGLAEGIAAGRLRYVPARLSAAVRVLGRLAPDVLVVPAVRRGSALAFGASVGWAPLALALAHRTGTPVVVEVDDGAPDLGGPELDAPGARIVTAHRPVTVPPRPEPTAADRSLAAHVCALLPDGATLQFGPGAVGDVVVRTVDRPVGVWSGLVSDAVADLAGRNLLREPAVGAYLFGGDPVRALAQDGGIRLTHVGETHDPLRIAALPGFVAINTALQVGLDGAVNVERIGGRWVAGMGGHPDFAAAAARSETALSVVALRSTHRDRSTIVVRPEVVSTARADVDVVVTEHGTADLRGCSDAERADRLLAVADPRFRVELARSAGLR